MYTIIAKETPNKACYGEYITLALPVTNIRYLFDKKPMIPEALGLDSKAIEEVLYGDSYMVVSSESEDYPIGTALTLEQYGEAMDAGARIEIQYGAKALVTIAAAKGIDLDRAIVHRIKAPDYDTEHRSSRSIEHLIFKVTEASRKVRQLTEEKAPDVIIKEAYKSLQRYVDAYIDNGRKGTLLNAFGEPYDSLSAQEHCLLKAIFRGEHDNWQYSLFDGIDVARLRGICEDIAVARADIDNADEDEIDEVCEKRAKEVDELRSEVEELARDTLQRIAEDRCPDLTNSHAKIIEAGLTSLLQAVENYPNFLAWLSRKNGLTNKKLKKVLFCGVIPNMDLTARHIRQEETRTE